ncbi:MAG: type II secretion system protein GspK [Campylobacterota bacterium]|nr:type II secretion system protein GspK [Campylobacterota bacterium]
MVQFIPMNMNKKAFALSIVLWIVAALLVGVAALTVFSKDSVHLSEKLNNKLLTQLKVENILESLKFYIITADYDNNSLINKTLISFPKKLIVDGRWYNIDKTTKISIHDTSGLLNIRTYPTKYIASMITTDKQKQIRYTIIDSIADWRDKNHIVELNGAEQSTYKLKKGLKYKVRNTMAIQDVEELKLIHGIDKLEQKQWNKFKKYLYYGRTSSINLALLDKKNISFLLGISQSYAQTLVNIRKDDINEFKQIISKLPKYNDDLMSFGLSKQFRIEIQATINNAKTILTTIIDFKQARNKQYTTIEYMIK